MQAVEGHAYAEITAGAGAAACSSTRAATSATAKTFVLVRKNGKEYHIYGTGKDRLVVGFHMPATATTPETGGTGGRRRRRARSRQPSTPKDLKLRKGEKVEPVEGHAYAEIVSGAREGMYINTSGNARHGEAFVLVEQGRRRVPHLRQRRGPRGRARSSAATTTTTSRSASQRAEARRRQLGRDPRRALHHTVRHELRRPRPERDAPRAVAGDEVQPSTPGTGPRSGRPSADSGRAQARTARSPRRAAPGM